MDEAGERPAFRPNRVAQPTSDSAGARARARAVDDSVGAAVAGAGLARRRDRAVPRRSPGRACGSCCRRWRARSALFVFVVLIAVAAVPLLRFRLPSTYRRAAPARPRQRRSASAGDRDRRRASPPASRIRSRRRSGARMSSTRCAPRRAQGRHAAAAAVAARSDGGARARVVAGGRDASLRPAASA